MKEKAIKSAVVVGGGPAGATAAALLARAGVKVALFRGGKRPDLIVGESLVPAIVPILQELGIEDEVRSFSTYKPGASFFPTRCEELSFPFGRVGGNTPAYAYNTPRDKFDQAVLEAAEREGGELIDGFAKLEVAGENRLGLAEESLAQLSDNFCAHFSDGCQPDFFLDATGRSRQFSRILGVSESRGPRNDIALFAHLDKAEIPCPGHVHMDRLEAGWGWRIPLPDRVSLGIVINKSHAEKKGDTAEVQFDALLREDAVLRETTAGAKRISPVMRYSNYQLISEQMHGPNWALTGDAAGFVDPIFSSGLFIAMDSGVRVARALTESAPERALAEYERYMHRHLTAWQKLVGYFYNGRLLTLLRFGNKMRTTTRVGKMIDPHMQRHMGRLFTGTAATSRYSSGLLSFMATCAIRNLNHRQLEIR